MAKPWTLKDVTSQVGKRFFITGGNSGVGYYAAVELARRGAVVVLGCRDRNKGEAALRRLPGDAVGPDSAAHLAELAVLDLASLESVREVAESQIALGHPLDGLINNAGVMAPATRQQTKDGFELQFGTNVLGHFALTCRLMPIIKDRVVTVSSIAHKRGEIDFDDLQSIRNYGPMKAYQQSKLADLMFAFELDRRLRKAKSDVISIAVHPGVARTRLFKVGSSKGASAAVEDAIRTLIAMFFNSAPGGAIPTIYAATSPYALGGNYYGSQGFFEMRGGDVGPAVVADQARDIDVQRRLWTTCAELTGVDLP